MDGTETGSSTTRRASDDDMTDHIRDVVRHERNSTDSDNQSMQEQIDDLRSTLTSLVERLEDVLPARQREAASDQEERPQRLALAEPCGIRQREREEDEDLPTGPLEQEGQDITTRVKDSTSDRGSNIEETPGHKGGSLSSPPPPTDYWVKQLVHTISQPRPPLPTFTGTDRKEYGMFLCEFHQYLTDNAVAESAKLRLLIRACTGDLKLRLKSFLKLDPQIGYARAKKMLDERLGDSHVQIEDMIAALMHGPKLDGEHVKPLQSLLDGIWDCMTEMEILGSCAMLDNFVVVSTIARRFTDRLADRYKNELVKYKDAHGGERPGIDWLKKLVSFSVNRLKEDQEPSCSYAKSGNRGVSSLTREEKDTSPRRHAVGLATTTREEQARVSAQRQQDNASRPTCSLCLNRDQVTPHPLHACETFKRMSVRARRQWAQAARLCFNCLKANHRAAY